MARKKRAYCSDECRVATMSKMSSETMAKTNRKHASARMKTKNPMHDPVAKAKMETSLRARGWKPPVRGGNGHGPTAAQLLLASTLGWGMEFVVATGHCRDGSGYPTAYKIDIANPILKIAIEVDGHSHAVLSRKKQDQKKTAFLQSLGWSVLRFLNREVTDDLAGCVQTVLSTISKLPRTTTTSPTAS
jgi:hypothetical protein